MSGPTRSGTCDSCGNPVTFFEVCDSDGERMFWMAAAHRAPCGAHCPSGGVTPGEEDVHRPDSGPCAR